jgi:hypothetical protein
MASGSKIDLGLAIAMEAFRTMHFVMHPRRPRPRCGAGSRTPHNPGGPILAILLALSMVAVSAIPAAAKTQWKSFKPSKSPGRACVHLGAKDMRYYKLDAQEPVAFTVTGPTRIQLMTRHLPAAGETGEKSYTLRVVRDGKEILTKRISAGQSKSGHVCNDVGHGVGASRKSYITVPKGKHVFQAYVADTNTSVGLRLYKQVTSTKKASLISFSPDAYRMICTLVTSDGHEYPHYHFDRTTPLRFQIHGPTTLTIYTRADFDQTMLASASYGVEVLRNGESHRVFHYDNVKKQSTATYKEPNCREILPGERRKLTLRVAAGTWNYELRPTENGHQAIAARILMPSKDVANSSGR